MKIVRKSQVFSRAQLLAKRENEIQLSNEKKILENIQRLPDEMIREIGSFICGIPKQIIDKTRENKKRKWYAKMARRRRTGIIKNLIETIDKNRLIRFITEGSIKKYPKIIKQFGPFYDDGNDNDETEYRGYELVEKWRNGELKSKHTSFRYNVVDESMKWDISMTISSYITMRHKEVQNLDTNELNERAHLYKSILYVTNKMKK
jgi:hypothetical protein